MPIRLTNTIIRAIHGACHKTSNALVDRRISMVEIRMKKVSFGMASVMTVIVLLWGYLILTGEGILDLIGEGLIALILCAIIGSAIYGLMKTFKRTDILSGIIAGVVVFLLLIGHAWMNIQLAPLRGQFYQALQKGPISSHMYEVTESGGHNDGPIIAPDYGGTLSAIVEERDKLAAAHGFYYLGGWYSDRLAPTVGFCIYTFGL